MSMDGLETAKDTVQVLTESAASHVGRIAVIITGAVRDVARELGDWATDAFEMRDAAKRAQADHN
jgi:chemotaxis response regulator CheB